MSIGEASHGIPRLHDTTLADTFETAALLHADRPALTISGVTRTYAELHTRALQLAAMLTAHGVTKGDRVGALCSNRHEFVEIFAAAAGLGAVFVPINTRLRQAEIEHVVRDAGCRVVFVDEATCDVQARGALAQLPDVGHVVDLDALALGPSDNAAPDLEVSGGDLCALMYTAAVGGAPRGAMMTHRSFVWQAAQIGLAYQLTVDRDTCLCLLPLYHTAGLCQVITAVALGIHTVCVDGFDENEAVALIDTHRATYFTLFAPMGQRIVDAAKRSGSALESLRIVSGLEHPAVARELLTMCPGVSWVASYGQTETNGLVASRMTRDIVGDTLPMTLPMRPAPLNVVRILDQTGGLAPVDVPGEIVVRGPNVSIGYWGEPADAGSGDAGSGDGWHHTGDIGRLDRDGLLWFMGRKETKELIKSGGENIYPAEVEAVLIQHPRVAGCTVIGVPDPTWMESVRAVVVAEPGADVTHDELVRFCRDRLGPYKKPSSVIFVDTLPRRPDGAVDRAAVKKSYGGGYSASEQHESAADVPASQT